MKKNDETSKKNNKRKEKQKKVATSEEKENAAEKERKRLERQRANEEREKERRVLAERNNNLLDQMNAFANGSDLDDVREFGQLNNRTSEFEELGNIPDLTPVAIESDEDPFTSDVVWECGQINTGSCNISDNIPLPAPVTPQHRSTIRQLKKTITELQNVSPRQEITIQQLQDTLTSLENNPLAETPQSSVARTSSVLSSSTSGGKKSTSRPTVGGKCPRATSVTLLQDPVARTPSILPSSSSGGRNLTPRPTVGGKCPRRSLLAPSQSGGSPDDSEGEENCESCRQLKQRIWQLEDQVKQLEGQGR